MSKGVLQTQAEPAHFWFVIVKGDGSISFMGFG
jgi:hypothetical protein